MHQYYVYILSSFKRTLYVGVTNGLTRRLFEHRHKLVPGFTAQYNVNRLVHYEVFTHARDAIAREKQIKSWSRDRKKQLIESTNPRGEDVSAQWVE
ncbi:MAG: GIY-YIG nuclease family protein [Armatimonadota bacterium]|nr:GIY-YIG nuclease family protein [Armatimonadota bacterium]